VKEITQMLQAFQLGEANAGGQLLRLVYEELRRLAAAQMAREKPGHTLQATALVHEAWLRLVDADGKAQFENRAHFFSVAAEAMRCLLIDAARRKLAARHGGGQQRTDLDGIEIAAPDCDDRVLAVHDAVERLAAVDFEKAEVVKLRYFVGLSVEETAEALGISERTARRHWTFARAWLFDSIRDGTVDS
jgi:RNA polymerase sigma factor (TIGR02999 family)